MLTAYDLNISNYFRFEQQVFAFISDFKPSFINVAFKLFSGAKNGFDLAGIYLSTKFYSHSYGTNAPLWIYTGCRLSFVSSKSIPRYLERGGKVCKIRVSKMDSFRKNEDCPASDDLLAFQTGDLAVSEGGGIRCHLKSCEFCAAEVEFYSHYPPAEENVEPENMPTPLFELAEALLNKHRDDSFFDRLMEENEISGKW